MIRYLLDTNILVAYVRRGPLGRWIEARYQLMAAPTAPIVSVVTLGEIWSLALQFAWGDAKRRKLNSILGSLVVVQAGPQR